MAVCTLLVLVCIIVFIGVGANFQGRGCVQNQYLYVLMRVGTIENNCLCTLQRSEFWSQKETVDLINFLKRTLK